MSSANVCKACGGLTEWDASVGSCVCIECGTLEDATQVVLAADLEPHERNSRSVHGPGPMLKSLRKPGWDLDGQSKEARVYRNRIAMHEFIRALAGRLGHSGAVERASNIFDTFMERSCLNWGRPAKLAAASSIALALRESGQADPLRDIAVLMNECTTSIAKAFAHIVSVLGHTKSSADPSLHIQPLVVHLATVLQTSPPALPSPLLKVLKPLAQDSMSVQHTAELLCALLLRARMFEGLPSGPVAAGAFLLALEALGRVQLPSLGILAGALGSRVGAAASTVLSRYRVARTLAEEWTRALPWTHLRGSSKGGKRAPSGEGKRTLVARALKDALDFQEDIWRKKVGLIPGLALEVNHDDDDEFISLVRNPDTARDGTPARPSPHKAGAAMKRKRSTEEDLIDVEAAEGVLRARLAPKRRPSTPQAVEKSLSFLLGSSPANGRRNLPIAGKASAVSHLLLADTDPHLRTPSRLAVLASINGGSGPEHIVDDDLFVPGELEELLRTADERDALARMVDWGDSLPTDRAPRRPRGEKVKAPKGVERINMDQLARLLDDTGDADATAQGPPSLEADLDWGGFIPFDDDGKEEDAAFGSTCTSRNLSTGSLAAAVADTVDDDEVEEWRPASPTSGCLDASDWYEF